MELFYAARSRDIVVCLGKSSEQTFLVIKLIQEFATSNRRALSDGGRRSVYILRNQEKCSSKATYIRQLTDLTPLVCDHSSTEGFAEQLETGHVLLATPVGLARLLRERTILPEQINLIIVDECHKFADDEDLSYVVKAVRREGREGEEKTRIIGLAVPLFSLTHEPGRLESELDRIEGTLRCQVETASDILSILRYSPKPREFIIEHRTTSTISSLQSFISTEISKAIEFLVDHRHDPTEIYTNEEFLEDIQRIPDPKEKPFEMLHDLSEILDSLGPWCADRAALSLLYLTEKLKVKTPYERHYLLLNMISSVLVKIRAICDSYFSEFSEKERIYRFTSPKVHRILEILKCYERKAKSEDLKEGGGKLEVKVEDLKRGREDLERSTEELKKSKEDLNEIQNKIKKELKIEDLKSLNEQKNPQELIKTEEAKHELNLLENKMKEELKIEGLKQTNEDLNLIQNEIKEEGLKTLFPNPKTPQESSKPEDSKPDIKKSREDFQQRREKRNQRQRLTDPDLLCGVIFVDKPFVAKVLFYLLNEISNHDEHLNFLSPLYTIERSDSGDSESEHRKQEEVLKRFRIHECNLLISTAVLEEGIDIPKCNFVMRYDFPKTYQSYVQCKSRARAVDAVHVLLIPQETSNNFIKKLARYRCVEKILLNKCSNLEPNENEEMEADTYGELIPWYKPLESEDSARVTFNSAISLVNRYCAKLPSDTFTRLTPEWSINLHNSSSLAKEAFYTCSLRLPINSPLKYSVTSYPMPNRAMARRMAALQLCVELHKRNEIDDNLLPIGKENFKAKPEDAEVPALPDESKVDLAEARPGTTKRRQYYYKKTAEALTDCRPRVGVPTYLYHINMVLSCPLPEEQNTRGRRIYPPEESAIGFGIVTLKEIPKICPFPIYTRSGEVRVELKLSKSRVILDEERIERIAVFLNYTFTNVLRLQQYLMMFDGPEASENSYMIVPVRLNRDKEGTGGAKGEGKGGSRSEGKGKCGGKIKSEEGKEESEGGGKGEVKIEKGKGETKTEEGKGEGKAEEAKGEIKNEEDKGESTGEAKNEGGKQKSNGEAGKEADSVETESKEAGNVGEGKNKAEEPENEEEEAKIKEEEKNVIVDWKVKNESKWAENEAGKEARNGVKIHDNEAKNEIEIEGKEAENKTGKEFRKGAKNKDKNEAGNEGVRGNGFVDWGAKNGGKEAKNESIRESKNECKEECKGEAKHEEGKEKSKGNTKNEKIKEKSIEEFVGESRGESKGESREESVEESTERSKGESIEGSIKDSIDKSIKVSIEESKEEPTSNPVENDDDEPDVIVDWDFLDRIYANRNSIPTKIPESHRRNFTFDPCKYHDAVIMPWYRSQDQPQYFYVAEICSNLNPRSAFPGEDYSTFEEYYSKKYGIKIQNLEQPLLDVDHTSARLNFLTPRYVNRKGVALPTSSEETKRAKRENLEQKQILVAELCSIHPFPASLWRQAVCLPCILYRINALLLADQIRCQVARAMNLGREELKPEFHWPPLDFGWSLMEVLKRAKESERTKPGIKSFTEDCKGKSKASWGNLNSGVDWLASENSLLTLQDSPKIEEIKEEDNLFKENDLEIGTWSSEMINELPEFDTFPVNFTSIPADIDFSYIRSVSPNFDSDLSVSSNEDYYYFYSSSGSSCDEESENEEDTGKIDRFKIAYTSENVAEAVEDERREMSRKKAIMEMLDAELKPEDLLWNVEGNSEIGEYRRKHLELVEAEEARILEAAFVACEEVVDVKKRSLEEGKRQWPQRKDENVLYIKSVAEKFEREKKREIIEERRDEIGEDRGERMRFDKEGLFSFDYQPELEDHPGPSPSLILQALTMSNANDGINLERLETIGDSFLKYAITTYLYCTYENIHEGKLSHLRSKQVSNLNLYRLGRRKCLGESMIATKFEPHDNWLPPCYYVPKELEQALIESGAVPSHDFQILRSNGEEQRALTEIVRRTELRLEMRTEDPIACSIPYNLITQHSIPDKSIADCVEALIGAYLIACGPRGALLFMAWLGIHVLPSEEVMVKQETPPLDRIPGSTPYKRSVDEEGCTVWTQTRYGKLGEPQNPLLRYCNDPEAELSRMLDGYEDLEKSIGYKFRDASYLLQAFTHASYQPNRLTDCYQRLEFLGDAVLDYLITRHLYEDSRQHSPGALTDLRSALVNNTIFASLAVRCGFHKYFRHLSPGLCVVINRFVRIQEENGHSISEEYYLIGDEECEEAEDVEVPKALGDVFESLAGAIYLDSGMSLDAVWSVYHAIMKNEIEQFSTNVPKSPIRELLELEPETAKFGKPEKLADGRRVRVTVDVFGKGSFKGIGRNYRIAKCTAAKCALKKLKRSQNNYHNKEKL